MQTTVTDKLNGISNTSKSMGPEERIREEFNSAIDFALDVAGSEGLEFLREWREGNVVNPRTGETDWTEWPLFLEKRNAGR